MLGELCREVSRELLAELLELSGISVNPNNLGRRPLRGFICNESAAMAIVRLGGERTSGRTCIAIGREAMDVFGAGDVSRMVEGVWSGLILLEPATVSIDGGGCSSAGDIRSGVGGCMKMDDM